MSGFSCIADIKAWQDARSLAAGVYRMTGEPPFSRDFGLRDQLRRAAVSVMSNIAEGFGRGTIKEFLRFLDIARGSAVELESLFTLIQDLALYDNNTLAPLQDLLGQSKAKIAGLTTHLRKQLAQEDR